MFKSSKAISSKSNHKEMGPGCMVLFFSIFLLAGLGFLWLTAIGPALRIQAAKDWPQVPCRILSSEVKRHSGDDGSTYSILIKYEYQYKGKHYTIDQYSFFTGASSGREGKAKVVAQHPPGKKTTCYVDPQQPDSAVLNRQFTGEVWFALIPLIFIVVGTGGIIFAVRSMIKGRDPSDSNLTLLKDSNQPATLQSRDGRWVKLLGITFIAIFWNGIISIFLFQAYKGFQNSNPDWFLTIFMIPFVIVGLGTIVGMFYYFLAFLNPQPILTVNRQAVPLGGVLDLVWDISGKAHRMTNLLVTLKGEESATYRRGTSTVTDNHTFAEIELYHTSETFSMAHGSASATIPQDTMHSFNASNNKITWTIHFHGDVPRWPDADVHFPIEVLPASQGDRA